MPMPSFLLSPEVDRLLYKLILGETKVLSNMSRLAGWQTISDEIKTHEAWQFVSPNEAMLTFMPAPLAYNCECKT
jgi:hypothetical protein